jgi:CRP-like cAMP-binding protein
VQTRVFEKHETIALHGDKATTIWFLLQGWVSLLRHTPDGKEVTVGLCTSGDLFGEAALFSNANYPYTAQALQDGTSIAVIPANTLRQLSETHREFSAYIMALQNERINRTQLKLEQMSSLSAAQRLGCFLLRLCQQHQGASEVIMPIDKHVVASYLGMKPETLSRSFQQLQPLGIHVKQNTITVSNVGKLVEYVCSSCSESGLCATESDVIASAG